MSACAQTIREALARAGHVGAADPRHIEAWMRLERGCLDGLSRQQFNAEVTVALQCVAAAPADRSEALAASFGL